VIFAFVADLLSPVWLERVCPQRFEKKICQCFATCLPGYLLDLCPAFFLVRAAWTLHSANAS